MRLNKVKIASRQSDLARVQAYMVGDALTKAHPGLQVEYLFRASLGDKNLTDPLWKMPEKGVFTQDFLEDLIADRCDLVVHSWKDLPVEKNPNTEIAATLARADSRDMLLVRKDRWEKAVLSRHFRVFSSSPRREYNLKPFLLKHLPAKFESVEFTPVRGNVPTRIEKLFSSESSLSDVTGLVLAKAALDRLLSADRDEFLPVKSQLRKRLKECHWMVLPLSQNPAAAAQGALAIEIHSTRGDVRELLRAIHHPDPSADVEKEREVLKSYGGGCHQKIGISVLTRKFGQVVSLRGLTDQSVVLQHYGLKNRPWTTKVLATDCWPSPRESTTRWYQRFEMGPRQIPQSELEGYGAWVARANALPLHWNISMDQKVWTAGVETWAKLAERGVWVNGTADGLGENEPMRLEQLEPSLRWCKLTHDEFHGAGTAEIHKILPTYSLKDAEQAPNIENKKYFYWMSGSAFKRALMHAPHLANLHHSCGPGNTFQQIKELLPEGKIEVFLTYREWYETLTGEKYV